MRMCFDKRVLIGLGVVALGVLAVSPRLLGSVAPLLLLAACPLSMVFMMRRMNSEGASCETGSQRQETDTAATRAGAAGPVAAPVAERDRDAELRELQEEVNRLKAETQLRGRERA